MIDDVLIDLLHAAQTFNALGNSFTKGSCLEKVELNYNAAVSRERSHFFTCRLETSKDILPVILIGQDTGLFEFVCHHDTGGKISIEGSFNQWGQDQEIDYTMHESADGMFSLFFDLNFQGLDLFAYRYALENRYLPDYRFQDICVHPEFGVCTIPDFKKQDIVSIRFILPESSRGEHLCELKVVKHPEWLLPIDHHLIFDSTNTCLTSMKICRKPQSGETSDGQILMKSPDSNLIFKVPVHRDTLSPPIHLIIDNFDIYYGKSVQAGDAIEVPIPLKTRGKGKLDISFFGNGVSGRYSLESDSGAEKDHKVLCRVETAYLSAGQARELLVRITSNSLVANTRKFDLYVHIELLHLHTFPVTALNWENTPLGEDRRQVVEFMRSDSLGPVENVSIEIPSGVKKLIRYERDTKLPHQIKFFFKSPTHDLESVLEDRIEIKAGSKDGKELTYLFPIRISTKSVEGGVEVLFNKGQRIRKVGNLSLKCWNAVTSEDSVRISRIHWQKGIYKRFTALKNEGKTKYPLVNPGDHAEFSFNLNRKRNLLFPKFFCETLKIDSNINGYNHIRHKLNILLLPIILSFPFVKVVGKLKIKKRKKVNDQRFIVIY
ncbi:hypothetical protein [Desulfobacter latus]|uniref:Uncharacterized protein n=1 Tax=Desulfobacter latus TaxID=2292 RepID=A0A850SX55_9BACT|nr:hypothetical protein [Desulfobacter latus]NWH05904.1 hypothetical protein [Desulfobacter latus]